jgi:hypothetical protein
MQKQFPGNVAVPGPPDGIFDLKFHQVAMYHPDSERAVSLWEDFGYYNWLPDHTLLRGTLHGNPIEVYENLFFNYELWPHEMEYIQYDPGRILPGDERDPSKPWISHWATYVDDLDAKLAEVEDEMGLKPYFIYVTVTHENPALNASGERFYECLIDTQDLLGHDLKLIQRVYPGQPHYPTEQAAEAVAVPA